MARAKTKTMAREEPAVEARPFVALDRLLGHDRAVAQLRAAVAAERVHHAWIFHGPVGVGKFTAAVGFAALLLDPTTSRDLAGVLRPDPESETQRLIRAGTHPDLHVVTKELAAISSRPEIRERKQTNIPKAVLNEFLLEPAARTRAVTADSAAAKVFIVDEAELIDSVGQNSLLKLLEEPPPGSVIILVTASEERLLPTIRSRCQRVAFGPLPDAAMSEWLKRSGAELEAAERDWILGFAGGSPGVAALAIGNDLYGWHRTIEPMLRRLDSGVFPIEMGSTLAELIDERAAAWVKSRPDASKDAANKAWARRMFSFVAEHYRRQLGEVGRAEKAAASIEVIAHAEQELAANVNLALVMENMVAQLGVTR